MGRHIVPASVLAVVVAVLPTVLQAQGRAVMAGAAHPMTAAPRAVVHAAPPAVAPVVSSARIVARAGVAHPRTTTVRSMGRPAGSRRHFVAANRALRPGCSTVPGLGFDVPHLAAVCGPGAVGAAGLPFFMPFSGGGFYIPSSVVVAEQGAEGETQQAEEVEAEPIVVETPRRAKVARPAQTAEIATESAASRHTEEFVFVRRDGTVFFAVAYAWENGTLRYVTSEGLRRSLARDALDLDATQQFNEQRGMNFRLPA